MERLNNVYVKEWCLLVLRRVFDCVNEVWVWKGKCMVIIRSIKLNEG